LEFTGTNPASTAPAAAAAAASFDVLASTGNWTR